MSELESGFSLSEVISLLKRRSAVVLGAAILGLIAGYLAFASAPPKYSATARVEVAVSPGGTPATQLSEIETAKDAVKADEVADAVRADLGIDAENRAIFGSLTVTSKETSRVLGLTYVSESAGTARDRVNAIAKAFLATRTEAATNERDAKLEAANADLTEARNALDSAGADLDAAAPNSSAQIAARAAVQDATTEVKALEEQVAELNDTATSAGRLVKAAPLPAAVLSKKALGMGVGVFGLLVLAGLGVALLVDRRDSMGGGRRKVEQLVPNANIRIMPTATDRKASPAEIDAAIDRLAVELAGGGSRGRATSVLVASTRSEPPVAMAEELASSLTFAGIPALFVLAGTSERDVRQAHVVLSFTDLITGPSITGPASLPDVAGAGTGVSAPLVTWLRPRGSAEASGLLRRAVVEALITRAGREGFEAVVFVAATPTRNAAAAALGQWVAKTAVIVEGDDSQGVEQAVSALREADVQITEVVWT